MSTTERLTKLAKLYARGILTEGELASYIIETVQDDRNDIIDAERNGTLVTP